MKYCGNMACRDFFSQSEKEVRCRDCGEELMPCVICVCGKADVNPKYEWHWQKTDQIVHHCPQCGIPLTAANLGHMMADSIRAMMQEIGVATNGRPEPLH